MKVMLAHALTVLAKELNTQENKLHLPDLARHVTNDVLAGKLTSVIRELHDNITRLAANANQLVLTRVIVVAPDTIVLTAELAYGNVTKKGHNQTRVPPRRELEKRPLREEINLQLKDGVMTHDGAVLQVDITI